MKKILFSVMAAMVSMASMADVALSDYDGTYSTSNATIAYYTPSVGSQTSALNVDVEALGATSVKLSINDFSFQGITVGDIEATLVAASDGEGGYELSTATAKIAGPTIESLGLSTELEIISAVSALYVEGGEKKMDLKLNVYEAGETSLVASVTISGAELAPATSVKENKALSVYPTVATSVINVPENGEFVIYSYAGSAVKSGVVSNGSISVSDLAVGNYIVSVNGKSARFVKK